MNEKEIVDAFFSQLSIEAKVNDVWQEVKIIEFNTLRKQVEVMLFKNDQATGLRGHTNRQRIEHTSQKEEQLMQDIDLTATIAQVMAQFLNDLEQAIGPIGETLSMFNNIYASPKPSTVKRRSSRRQLVQAKRKRLGLPVNGKVKPFMWSGELCKPSRKESYEAALEADKMMRVYAQLGDAEDHRQYIMQRWISLMV